MDLHPIEAAWRRFRNSEHADLLRKSLESRSSYLRFIKLSRLPNEIVLPGAVAWNLVALEEARARGERTGSSISIDGSLLVTAAPEPGSATAAGAPRSASYPAMGIAPLNWRCPIAWAAYREAKTIYTKRGGCCE